MKEFYTVQELAEFFADLFKTPNYSDSKFQTDCFQAGIELKSWTGSSVNCKYGGKKLSIRYRMNRKTRQVTWVDYFSAQAGTIIHTT